MKWMKGDKRHLRTAFSAVFLVQLLVASFCFVTPASAVEPVVSEHCHEQMGSMSGDMPMEQPSHHGSSKGCAHCDAPQNLNTVSATTDLTPSAMLLAIVAPFTEAVMPASTDAFTGEKAQAPPDSSGILLSTTQRIRI